MQKCCRCVSVLALLLAIADPLQTRNVDMASKPVSHLMVSFMCQTINDLFHVPDFKAVTNSNYRLYREVLRQCQHSSSVVGDSRFLADEDCGRSGVSSLVIADSLQTRTVEGQMSALWR